MNEREYRIEHFEENFGRYKGKRIFLYGTGLNAAEILCRFHAEYGFRGVIRPEQENAPSEFLYEGGRIPAVTLEEAFGQNAEVIIIAAMMYSAEAVWQRISGACAAQGVLILDLYGTDQTALHAELEGQQYLDLEGWKKRTEGYDVVSFELLDTVIVRDIFRSRPGVVRPVFRKLIPWLREKGVRVIFIAHPEYEASWYRTSLAADGLIRDEQQFLKDCFFNTGRQEFFRELKDAVPGERYLHIGFSILENGIMPRLCGFDTCRMVFFDIERLTGFTDENKCDAVHALPDREACLEAVKAAEAVSFDLFDTLLVRRTAEPGDVFRMAALRAEEEGILSPGQAGRLAEERETAQSPYRTLEEIYESLDLCRGMDKSAVRRLCRIEIECEDRLLIVREPVKELLDEAVRLGKRVVLTTDMYLSGEQLGELLQKRGVSGFERIFVSCEYGLDKKDGLFYQVAKELGVRREEILHFGDSVPLDAVSALNAGLGSIVIPSVREMAAEAGITVPKAEEASWPDMAAACFYGTWLAGRFADPFGTAGEDPLRRYGVTAAAPVTAGYLIRLLCTLFAERPAKVLFAARDGWLLRQLYEKYRPEGLPDAVYFHVSRHAAFLLAADRKEAAVFIADMAKGMALPEVLRRFYEVNAPEPLAPEEDPCALAGTSVSESLLEEALERHREEIKTIAGKARAGFERYLDSCGITGGRKYVYIDFVGSGTTQRILEEAMGTELKGFYFGRPIEAAGMPVDADTYIGTGTEAEWRFISRYMEMEYYITSLEPSLRSYGEDGSPRFFEEVRSAGARKDVELVQQGIRDFLEEFTELCGWEQNIAGTARKDPGKAKAYLARLSSLIPAEKVCGMYLASADGKARQDYYDDWSGKWV